MDHNTFVAVFGGKSGGGGDPALAVLNDGNTVAWYDYTENITEDTGVSIWGDKSGNGNDLAQATGNNQPTLESTGILFDGSNDSMTASGVTLEQPTMIYAVLNQKTWTANDIVLAGSGGSFLRQRTTLPLLRAYSGDYAVGVSLTENTYGIIRWLLNGASSKVILNSESPKEGDFGASDFNDITIGSAGGGITGWANVEFKELIFRNKADSEADETIIYNYLYNKYMLGGGASAAFLAEDGSEMLFEDGNTVIQE